MLVSLQFSKFIYLFLVMIKTQFKWYIVIILTVKNVFNVFSLTVFKVANLS